VQLARPSLHNNRSFKPSNTMSQHAAIFKRSHISSTSSKLIIAVPPAPRLRHFIELAANLFPAADGRRVVAFSSVGRGAGVTTVVKSLAAELVRSGRDVEILKPPLSAPSELSKMLGAPSTCSAEHSEGSSEYAIEAARVRSRCVLIDCGSFESSVDLLQVASKVDGVVLVVEAGTTDKHQIERVALSITNSGGILLGVVMNKRRYPVPTWLYRVL
jgi:Mrp family chromosome partitioning ATPase